MGLEDNIRHLTAAGVFAAVPGIEDDITTPPGNMGSMDFLSALKSGATPEEAISFAAFMMQPRLAVWWGHECLRSLPDLLSQADHDMMELAANWVADPSEENRRRALDAASAANDLGAGGWIAMAAGWSGGSLVAEEFDAVPPPAILCGRAVQAGALTILAIAGPEGRSERIASFISMAEVLANAE